MTAETQPRLSTSVEDFKARHPARYHLQALAADLAPVVAEVIEWKAAPPGIAVGDALSITVSEEGASLRHLIIGTVIAAGPAFLQLTVDRHIWRDS